jgi:hypothetical protein
MGKLSNLLVFTFCALSIVAAKAGQTSSKAESSYPNELPNVKLYQEAKWNSLQPYVSTIDDVEKLLGEPVPIIDDRLHGDFGFECDPDWIIVIDVVGKGEDLPDSVAGRVLLIRLYPKKRVSMVGADFSAFRAYTYREGAEEARVYYDQFGLRYVVYAKGTADGRFHTGDLESVMYGPSDAATAKLSRQR